MDPTAREKITQHVAAIEQLAAERADLGKDIAERYKMVASDGFSKTAMKNVVKLRKLPRTERDTLLDEIDLYLQSLDMSPVEAFEHDAKAEAQAKAEQAAEDRGELPAQPAPAAKPARGKGKGAGLFGAKAPPNGGGSESIN